MFKVLKYAKQLWYIMLVILALLFVQVYCELTLPAMVVSRGLSYYTELILSAVMTTVAHFTIGRPRKQKREER